MDRKSIILSKKEGRKVEFKEVMPQNNDIAKTVVAFANDAGGEIFIGIDNNGNITGINEDKLTKFEEQISNVIHDTCYPTILPDIIFLEIDNKHIIQITIHKGNTPPYYIKNLGKNNGSYIRVGSTNRKADSDIIKMLELKGQNISFDSDIVYHKTVDELDITEFKQFYKERKSEDLNINILRKLQLTKMFNNIEYPTNALVLLSDDELRYKLFPFAKVECARFKGVSSDTFIDKKTIDCHIAKQPEETFNFILRHINENAKIENVYTVSRWEYPINAIREVVRNAIVHRNYSLSGKDIKVAIYDDMIEITSPGNLPPSIDYNDMDSRQSDAINKIIAPVFKHLDIIDQWGNGLKIISKDMQNYPNITLNWKETGLAFQIQFIKSGGKNNTQTTDNKDDFENNLNENNIKNNKIGGKSGGKNNTQTTDNKDDFENNLNENNIKNNKIGGKSGGKNNTQTTDNKDDFENNLNKNNIKNNKIGGKSGGKNNTQTTDNKDDFENKIIKKIINLINKDNHISITDISEKLLINKRKCERILSKLKDKKVLERQGSSRAGYWIINKKK